jgi:hypothetical protein
MSQEPMRISETDLFDARVEGYLEEQDMIRRAVGEIPEQSLFQKILYSSYFYLGLAGCVGALVGWGCIEPFLVERALRDKESSHVGFVMLFPVTAALIGIFVGSAEGIISRNFLRALLCGAVGLGIGFAGSLVLLFIVAGPVYLLMQSISFEIMRSNPPADGMPHGMALFVQIVGRAIAWSIVAIPAGMGQGIALREKKVVWNGILGAVLGGLLGGMLFDPISIVMKNHESAAPSRAVGLATIGLMVGVFVGLVEQWTKTAWLLMRQGPLAGKQFVLYRQQTTLGSSPKADIYLFKDDAIEPQHALLHNRGGRYELEDCGSRDGTYVNGLPIRKQLLKPGDQIVLGKTVLEFAFKEVQ